MLRTEDQVARPEGTLLPVRPVARVALGNIVWSNRQHHGEASLSGHLSYRCWHYLAQELAQLGAEAVVETPTGVSFKVFESGIGSVCGVASPTASCCSWALNRLIRRILCMTQPLWSIGLLTFPQAVRSQWTFLAAVAGCVMSSSERNA